MKIMKFTVDYFEKLPCFEDTAENCECIIELEKHTIANFDKRSINLKIREFMRQNEDNHSKERIIS